MNNFLGTIESRLCSRQFQLTCPQSIQKKYISRKQFCVVFCDFSKIILIIYLMCGFHEILLQSWSPKILHELLVSPLITVRFAKTEIIFEKNQITKAYISSIKIVQTLILTLLERETSCLQNTLFVGQNYVRGTPRQGAFLHTTPNWDTDVSWFSKGQFSNG